MKQKQQILNTTMLSSESGRSMVEMLGVLAIIGVLSVGGIAGYTMAMNKHKANEILNAASVRATTISAQIQRGKEANALTLAEFGSEKVQGVSFSPSYTDGATTFDLTLTWDADSNKSSLCKQIQNIVGENGVPKIETNCDKITYNVDLSAGGNNTSNNAYDGPLDDDDSECVPELKLGGEESCQVCINGSWIDSNAKCQTSGTTCVDGNCTILSENCIASHGICTQYNVCEDYSGWCETDSDCVGSRYDENTKMCVRDVEDGEIACVKNSDCKTGEFCNYPQAVDPVTGPNGKVGRCDMADSYFEITASDYTQITGSNWILSKKTMNWFSANNFCLANNMRMVTSSEGGCSDCFSEDLKENPLGNGEWWSLDEWDREVGEMETGAFWVGGFAPRTDVYQAFCR